MKRYGNFSPVQEQFFYSDEPVIDASAIDLPDDSVVPEVPEVPEKTSEERKASIEAALIDLGYKQPVVEEEVK